MRRQLFLFIIFLAIFSVPRSNAFAQAANCSCSGGSMCCAVLGGQACQASSACSLSPVCGPCTAAGVSYCTFNGGYSVTDCGHYVPPPPPPTLPPAPTATPGPTSTPMPTSTPRPTSTPVPTQIPTPTFTPVPTSTPVPTPTPQCHEVQTCPTGANGSIQLCTFTCE